MRGTRLYILPKDGEREVEFVKRERKQRDCRHIGSDLDSDDLFQLLTILINNWMGQR